MKAIAITEYGGRDKLRLMDLPDPMPGPGEIRIRIRAAGVNPVDVKIREGFLVNRLPNQFPLILGWEASGVVDSAGAGATRFKIGDEVVAYCRKPIIQFGTYAEYVVVPEDFAAHKPRHASFEEAAAIPLAALTAYQCLFEAANLQPGETVLVQAAAGGVGSFAVQLAARIGCIVLGTASGNHHDYIHAIGVKHPIDYRAEDFRTSVKQLVSQGVDVVLDGVGGEVMNQSADVLKPGGRLVSILEPDRVQKLVAAGINAHYVFVAPNGGQLETLAGFVDAGELRVRIEKTFPLEDAARAHELLESRHVAGKLVLTVGG